MTLSGKGGHLACSTTLNANMSNADYKTHVQHGPTPSDGALQNLNNASASITRICLVIGYPLNPCLVWVPTTSASFHLHCGSIAGLVGRSLCQWVQYISSCGYVVHTLVRMKDVRLT